MFNKLLVANRGEIALRVMRTAKAMGYRTVAVYSEADSAAPHVQFADEAVCIGPAPVGESYLKATAILQAAEKTGADAIHPGYGFLSENADFARTCEQAGITFVGPPPDAIELMGSKRLSKIAMLKAGVPCIPGYEGEDQSDAALTQAARDIGYPLMIKASAGGGGRGMRLVFEEKELAGQIKTARSEAQNAFGSGELILEKAVIKPRHIEIQVFADQQGNTVYLGERDCSIQRRHQKVVEECPSPFVDPELRQRMGEAAVEAARACGYVGAGTVEFLVDAEKSFYFLEMNTRLQVEHPVTELVTGTDLVAWQLDVAAGLPLPKQQADIELNGHAIEVRFYAEDPANDFLPQTGTVLRWKPYRNSGVRIDAGIQSGQVISPHYDPMIAKIIGYGRHREEARRRLCRAVADSQLFGLTHNQRFLHRVLQHQRFIDGEATTAFLGEDFIDDPSLKSPEVTTLNLGLAAFLLYRQQHTHADYSQQQRHWRSASPAPWPMLLESDGTRFEVALQVSLRANALEVVAQQGEEQETFTVLSANDEQMVWTHQGVRQSLDFLLDAEHIHIKQGDTQWQFTDHTHAGAQTSEAVGSGQIRASMDGAIVDVRVEPGAAVSKGDTLVVLEAMKMEHQLKAEIDGTVQEVNVAQGDQVKARQVLVTIE